MMQFNENAVVHVPGGGDLERALELTTHMAIAAHQDDVEIMAAHGVLQCHGHADRGFAAVVLTDGAGSPRDGAYKEYSDEQMMWVRVDEQKAAADAGGYAAAVLLRYPSGQVKKPGNERLIEELRALLRTARPEVLYTHNLADKHQTHVGVTLRVLEALRGLEPEERPRKLYGCEVWRALDWVNDGEKTVLDLSGNEALRNAIVGVYHSQIAGGKRYDLATLGRQLANATFYASHDVDAVDAAAYAMDLTPVMNGADPVDYVLGYIDRFKDDVRGMMHGSL